MTDPSFFDYFLGSCFFTFFASLVLLSYKAVQLSSLMKNHDNALFVKSGSRWATRTSFISKRLYRDGVAANPAILKTGDSAFRLLWTMRVSVAMLMVMILINMMSR